MISSMKEIRENGGIECDKEVGSPLTEGLSEVVIIKLGPRTKGSSHKDLGEAVSIRGSCKDKKGPKEKLGMFKKWPGDHCGCGLVREEQSICNLISCFP